jgi:CRISPR system Cascade subunit CasD
MSIFTIRWRGPVMSMTGARIDGYADAVPIPAVTTVAGLLGAALGLRRDDPRLVQLTDSIRHAVVVHDPGAVVIDFQTADLTRMPQAMWEVGTDGRVRILRREGSAEAQVRRTQNRALRTGADMTVLVEVLVGCPFSREQLLAGLRRPVFPIYLGRTSCPPSRGIAGRLLTARSLEEAASELEGTAYLPADAASPKEGDLITSIPARGYGDSRWVIRQ